MTHTNHHGFEEMEIGSIVSVWWDQWIKLWVVTRHDAEGNQVEESEHWHAKKDAVKSADSIYQSEPRWSQVVVETKDGIKNLHALRGGTILKGE